MSAPLPSPTLLTSTSMRPKALTAASTTERTPLSVDTSALTETTRALAAALACSWRAALASASSPRAQITRLAPSAASAVAPARPSPRLPPVTMATFPVSPRSILLASGQVVELPVEIVEDHGEGVLVHVLGFAPHERRKDQGQHRALNRAA